MSRSLNMVLLLGHLGNDPELRYTASGMTVANISVATSQQRKDAKGEKVEVTEWHRVVLFGKLAEIAGEYCKKGTMIHIEGQLSTKKYEKEGQTHYSTEIIGNKLLILSGGAGKAGAGNAGAGGAGAAGADAGAGGFQPDDDIPF